MCDAERRSVHGHRATVLIVAGCSATVHGLAATVLIVAGRSATVHGQAATVRIVAGRSATVGTIAKKDCVVILLPCMPLFTYINCMTSIN